MLPLLREIGNLKRVTSSARPRSIAARAFATAWSALGAGGSSEQIALEVTAGCLAATRLGDLDRASLADLGVPIGEIVGIQRATLGAFADQVDASLHERLIESCDRLPPFEDRADVLPFVTALTTQPRAGATCPGKPRIVLGPAENHAEHCLVVAVYAVLLAEPGSDLGSVFTAALAHHLHNAVLPDAGFTGEMLLGPHLQPVLRRATERVLAQLPDALRADVIAACRILPDARTAEGRAFHAGDVLDRVLEIEQNLTRRRVTMDEVLGDMALVHDGPVKGFHDRVLAEIGLA